VEEGHAATIKRDFEKEKKRSPAAFNDDWYERSSPRPSLSIGGDDDDDEDAISSSSSTASIVKDDDAVSPDLVRSSPTTELVPSHETTNDDDTQPILGGNDAIPTLTSSSSGRKKSRSGEDTWEKRCGELIRFKNLHGHCRVPQLYPDNPPLGKWVNAQRSQYKYWEEGKKSILTEEKIEALNNLGFIWRIGPAQSTWNERLEELKQYKAQFGNCNVPQVFPECPKLSKWVKNQKAHYKYYKEGKRSSMNEYKIKALEALGFEWSNTGTRQRSSWKVRYEELQQFQIQNGHCRVPTVYAENPKLGQWVNSQRTQYKYFLDHKPTSLTEEKIRLLDGIGFLWRVDRAHTGQRHRKTWDERLEELRQFRSEHGHCVVPILYVDNPKLGHWVNSQRTSYKYLQEGKPSSLTDDRIRSLNELGFAWRINQSRIQSKSACT